MEASAPGHVPFSTKVNVFPKGHAVVTVPWLRELPATPQPTKPVPAADQRYAEQPAESASERPLKVETRPSILPWVLDGVGIVGIGVGSYFGLRALSKADDARTLCPDGICLREAGKQARDSASRSATLSNVAFTVGAGALVTGIILHFVLPPRTEESEPIGLTPILDRSNVGLSLTGRLGS